MKVFTEILGVFFELQKAMKLHWTTRRAYLEVLQAFLKCTDTDTTFVDSFMRMLKDEDYRVRVTVSKFIVIFFELYEDENGILEDIKKHLPPLETGKGFLTFPKKTSKYSVS